jgi:hypothetical protein
LGRWAAAVAACRAGEALARRSADGSTEFTPLMDDIAVAAARAGSTAGYDGDQLEVRIGNSVCVCVLVCLCVWVGWGGGGFKEYIAWRQQQFC